MAGLASKEAAELLRDLPGTINFVKRLCDAGRANDGTWDGDPERLTFGGDEEGPASEPNMPSGLGMLVC